MENIYFGGIGPVSDNLKSEKSKIFITLKIGNDYIYSTSKDNFEELVEDINKNQNIVIAKLIENGK